MYRILLITLAAASASQSCYKYCTQLDGPEKDAAPDDCNCTTLNIVEEKFKNQRVALDDTGVYFEPAQDLSQKQSITRPFHISNPIKVMTKSKRSQIKERTITNKDFSFKSVKQTVYQSLTSNESEHAPSYFDLDIEEKERSSEERQINLIHNLESTERTLVECLDLHFINISRKYDVTEKFKELWEERNLTAYDHLPDSDLNSMIREYCSEPEFIVEESLREIERNMPKKKEINYTIISDSISPPTLDINRDNNTFPLSLSDLKETEYDSTSSDVATTQSTSTYFTSNEHSNYMNDNTIPVTECPLNSTPIHSMNDAVTNSIEDSKEIYNKTIIDSVEDEIDFSHSTLEMSEPRNSTTVSKEIFDLDTMPSEVFYTTVYKEKEALGGMTIGHPYPISYENDNTLDVDNVDYDLSTTATPVLDRESQAAMKESEVLLPKIITKEFNNNTIKTFIDGYESLPNNDFSEEPKPVVESTTFNNTNSDDNFISGNLYFGSEQELVPIRLTPSEGGKFNISINGDTLCDKFMKKNNHKSHLLTTLCDSVKSNMVRYNNSSMP